MTDTTRTSASRPRIIERWFPCAEVSAASGSGWGSSNSETLLMAWFAKRPLAQSRAAVLTSLLPWPEDEGEQKRVQAVLREALGVCQDPSWYACRKGDVKKCTCDDAPCLELPCGDQNCENGDCRNNGSPNGPCSPDCTRKSHMQQASRTHAHGIVDCAKLDPSGGYDAARTDVLRLLKAAYPDRPAEMLDPFSGRGLIPLEAARYGQQAHAIDYSPVATLASRLLIDWPFRDWTAEPELPFDPPGDQTVTFDPTDPQRLVRDIAIVQAEVQRRIERDLDEFYPDNDRGEKPWGYLWASVIPCDGCGRDIPLYGSNVLRKPNGKKNDPGCSFEIHPNGDRWTVTVIDGITDQSPTMRARTTKRGKLAWCPYPDCGHGHELPEHKRLVAANYHKVEMLVVSDLDGTAKTFRTPTEAETSAAEAAKARLAVTTVNGLPGRPDEPIPLANSATIRALVYGARTYGDLSIDRQNLLHATIAQAIADIAAEMTRAGASRDYTSAMAGYCGTTLVKKLKRSTRGTAVSYNGQGDTQVGHIFLNESSVAFNYDSFETGIGMGPGTWNSVSGLPGVVRQLASTDGGAAHVERGSALNIPHRDGSLDAVTTDPPYEMMIDYTDASDLFYVWLRRALAGANPDFAMTAHPGGVQEKAEELIVKKNYETKGANEHRTPESYRSKIAEAFAECRRVVHDDGVVSIVFGHGDPDAWQQFLDAISDAGLVLTGAWPANTEKGGQAGSANIQTTLTLACRPAPVNRPDGRVAEVDAEMRRVIAERVHNVWSPSGLSYVDQKMAASGPALEVVGRYERVLDKRGQPVDLTRYLPLARQAVTEAHNLSFDSLPLDTFDQKTRFALEWVRSYGRKVQAASEARWNRLASDLEELDTEGVLRPVDKGVRLAFSKEAKVEPGEGLSLFEVALASGLAWKDGTLADAAAVIRDSKVEANDPHFWACVRALSQNLPETDADGAVWTSMVRNREALAAGVENAEAAATAAVDRELRKAKEAKSQMFEQDPSGAEIPRGFEDVIVEDPNSLFGQEGV